MRCLAVTRHKELNRPQFEKFESHTIQETNATENVNDNRNICTLRTLLLFYFFNKYYDFFKKKFLFFKFTVLFLYQRTE